MQAGHPSNPQSPPPAKNRNSQKIEELIDKIRHKNRSTLPAKRPKVGVSGSFLGTFEQNLSSVAQDTFIEKSSVDERLPRRRLKNFRPFQLSIASEVSSIHTKNFMGATPVFQALGKFNGYVTSPQIHTERGMILKRTMAQDTLDAVGPLNGDPENQASESKIDIKEMKSESHPSERFAPFYRKFTFTTLDPIRVKDNVRQTSNKKTSEKSGAASLEKKAPASPKSFHGRESPPRESEGLLETFMPKKKPAGNAHVQKTNSVHFVKETSGPGFRTPEMSTNLPFRNSFTPRNSDLFSSSAAKPSKNAGSPAFKDSYKKSIFGFKPTIVVDQVTAGSTENFKAFTIDRHNLFQPQPTKEVNGKLDFESPLTAEYLFYKSSKYRVHARNLRDLIDRYIRRSLSGSLGLSAFSPLSTDRETNSFLPPGSRVTDSKTNKLSADEEENHSLHKQKASQLFQLRIVPVGEQKPEFFPASPLAPRKPRTGQRGGSPLQSPSPPREEPFPRIGALDNLQFREDSSATDREFQSTVSRLFELNNFEIVTSACSAGTTSVVDEDFQIKTARHFRPEQLEVLAPDFDQAKASYLELASLLQFLVREILSISHGEEEFVRRMYFEGDPLVLGMLEVYGVNSLLKRKRGRLPGKSADLPGPLEDAGRPGGTLRHRLPPLH